MKRIAHPIFALLFLSTIALSNAQDFDPPPIEELMSSDVFIATGLHKLSAEELRNLNQWLVIYGQTILQVYGGVGSSHDGLPTPAVIESRIDGEFQGWDGETIFRLQNGQIWQQARYAYRYHYAYIPRVTIIQSNGRYIMQVEGIDDTLEVVRIR
jgi:hypothetical protein